MAQTFAPKQAPTKTPAAAGTPQAAGHALTEAYGAAYHNITNKQAAGGGYQGKDEQYQTNA